MLLRMIDGAGNVLLPSAIIPAAERHGVMRKFDRWVISTTLRALRETTALTPDVCIGINLSPHSLNDDKFANFLLEELEACSLRPQQVERARARGIGYAQGFAIAAPRPLVEFV